MRRLLFTLLILLSINTIYGQANNHFNSLKKYSYFIEGINFKTDNIAIGTGFFIRTKNNVIYFITAKHVFSGCTDSLVKYKEMPNVMNIFLDKSGTVIPINSAVIKDTSQCLPMDSLPDMIAIKIGNNWSPYINSVEKFIEPPIKKIGATEIIGYPIKENVKLGFFRIVAPSETLLPSKKYKVYTSNIDTSSGKIDSINYRIFPKNESLVDSISNGYSGSPVFTQDRRTKKIQLECMVLGTGENKEGRNKCIMCLKLKYILNLIGYLKPIDSK